MSAIEGEQPRWCRHTLASLASAERTIDGAQEEWWTDGLANLTYSLGYFGRACSICLGAACMYMGGLLLISHTSAAIALHGYQATAGRC